jgi:transposase
LKKADNPDKIIRHKVTKCTCCGENLENIEAGKIESRQIFDIPLIKVEVTEHQAEEKKCPNCGTKNKAEFPEGVTNITQYGNNIKAFAVWLKNAGFVSYERIVELFKEFFGIEISQATLQSFDLVTAGNLENFENDVKAKLFQERVIHADESGIRIEGELNWVHSISSEGYTLYFLHEKRGGEAMKAMGILPEYKGTVIHDGWASYWDFSFRHGLCNAHHLRELVWAYEEEGQDWAWDFGGLLKKIKWSKEDHFPLSSDEIDYFLSEYNRIIEEGYAANPITIKVRGKKRGKPKRGKVLCLLDRLKEHKDSVTLFMREKDVPFDNNLAERDIRMIKVQQKVSGTFRSRAGGKAFCRIRSLISTARKQCYKAFQAILDALKGNRFSFMAE